MDVSSEISEEDISNNQYFNSKYATDVDNNLWSNLNDDNVVSYHYERRGSRNPNTVIGSIISRRVSAQQTTNYVPRRTPFMDSSINRYKERLRETDESIKEAIEEMPLTKYE